jgi:hypothetical protein
MATDAFYDDSYLIVSRLRAALEGPEGHVLEQVLFILENSKYRGCAHSENPIWDFIKDQIKIIFDGTEDRKKRNGGCCHWRTCGPGQKIGCGPGNVQKEDILHLN